VSIGWLLGSLPGSLGLAWARFLRDGGVTAIVGNIGAPGAGAQAVDFAGVAPA
jgi:hypothetical protein